MTIALLFDYDDTLVQTRECKFAAVQALSLRSYGRTLGSTEIEQHWGKPYPQFFGDLFDVAGTGLDEVLFKYEQLNEEFPMRLHADAQRLIDDILPSYFCGIVSAASRKRIFSQLHALGVPHDRFDFIQGAEETTVHKPDPAVFEPAITAIRNRQGPHAEILYIGDAFADYQAALGAGLRFIGIPRTVHSRRQLEAAGARVLDSLDQLPAAI
jgi:HAD superfamily hydrolase (TIGR01549 family)